MAFAARVGRALSPLAVQALLQDQALTVSAAGTTAAAATDLSAAFNVITTCVLGADGVQIPFAEPGDEVWVVNTTAITLYAYPQTGGAFNGQTTNAPVAIAPGRGALFKYTNTISAAVNL